MAETIKLEVVTPKGAVLSEDVDIVTAPGYGGEFGVLANHAPFLSTIKIGVLSYKQEGTEDQLMISGGFCTPSTIKKRKRLTSVSIRLPLGCLDPWSGPRPKTIYNPSLKRSISRSWRSSAATIMSARVLASCWRIAMSKGPMRRCVVSCMR